MKTHNYPDPTQFLFWNSADGTLDISMGYDGVVQQVGLEYYYRVKASAAITNGDCVMYTGAVGASGYITAAPATGLAIADGIKVLGIATMDIPNNGIGYVTCFGVVRGINTTGSHVGETWADGDVLYYNPAHTGGLTKNVPAAPNVKAVLGSVINAGAGGSGSILVRVSSGSALGYTDSNVQFGTLANNDVVAYNSSTSRWENKSISGIYTAVYGA
jgi:hypothetical protein